MAAAGAKGPRGRHGAGSRAGREWLALALATVVWLVSSPTAAAELGAAQGGSAGTSAPGVTAPAEMVRELQAALAQAVQRFEARDVAGVLSYVSDQYRTGPLTKAGIREELIAIYSLYDLVRARIRIDEVRMVDGRAWVYSTGEVSGRLLWVGTWVAFLSWEHELEVARREAGGWRLFGYQQ